MLTRPVPKKHVTRAYIRAVSGASEAVQRACLQKLDPKAVEYEADQRDAWLASIGPNCTAWVYRLDIIAVLKEKGSGRPTADYSATIAELSSRLGEGTRVVEGLTGVSSDDKTAWRAAIERGHNLVVAGRRLSRQRAKEIGAKGLAARSYSRAATRFEEINERHRKHILALWRSAEYANREEAADAIAEYCRQQELPQLGKLRTLQRVLKGRVVKCRR